MTGMATRLSDSEFAERTRAANRRRSGRQRERLAEKGRVGLTVWVPAEVRRQLADRATAEQRNISEITTALLSAALANEARSGRDESASTDGKEHSLDRDALIYTLHGEGLSLAQIAARLVQQGIVTTNGTPIAGSTIKRVLSYRGLKPNS